MTEDDESIEQDILDAKQEKSSRKAAAYLTKKSSNDMGMTWSVEWTDKARNDLFSHIKSSRIDGPLQTSVCSVRRAGFGRRRFILSLH